MEPRPPMETTSTTAEEATGETDEAAADRTRQMTESGGQQARNFAATATVQATDVATHAGEQARQVADEARSQLRTLSGQARDQLRTQAEAQTQRASKSLRTWGDQARALAEGRIGEAGTIGEYTRDAARRLSQWADRIDERGFDGLVSDVQAFARRRPGAFIAACAVAGFAVSRIARSAQTESWETETREQMAARSPEGESAIRVPPSPVVEPSTTAPLVPPDTKPTVVLEDEPQGEVGTRRQP